MQQSAATEPIVPTKPEIHRPTCVTPRIYEADRNQQEHRKLIRSRRWQRFRSCYLADHPLCSDCGQVAVDVHHHTRRLIDHPEDLCDPCQVVALCHSCHTIRTNRGE